MKVCAALRATDAHATRASKHKPREYRAALPARQNSCSTNMSKRNKFDDEEIETVN